MYSNGVQIWIGVYVVGQIVERDGEHGTVVGTHIELASIPNLN